MLLLRSRAPNAARGQPKAEQRTSSQQLVPIRSSAWHSSLGARTLRAAPRHVEVSGRQKPLGKCGRPEVCPESPFWTKECTETLCPAQPQAGNLRTIERRSLFDAAQPAQLKEHANCALSGRCAATQDPDHSQPPQVNSQRGSGCGSGTHRVHLCLPLA